MNYVKIIEWMAVVITLFASWLVSRDFLQSAKLVFVISNILWIFLGYKWNKPPVMVLSIIMLVIYTTGLNAD